MSGYRPIIDRYESVIGNAFNLGTARDTSILKIAQVIAQLGNVEIKHIEARPGEVKSFALDSAKANDMLGWMPGVPIEIGLERTWKIAESMKGF